MYKFGKCATAMVAIIAFSASAMAQDEAAAVAEKPAALVADCIPAVPAELADRTRPYLENRTAGFSGWHPVDRSMLISTRFANTSQVHSVRSPGAARTQLSFESDRIRGSSYAPVRGDILLVQKDVGGSEFNQIYTLADGRLTLLTDGESRNNVSDWSDDGELIAYSSTLRNGRDTDIYVMNPRDPATARMVAQVKGGGWSLSSFAPDKNSAIVRQYISVTRNRLFLLDLLDGDLRAIGDHDATVAYGGIDFAPDSTLWATSDEGSDFKRLGTIDTATGAFTPVIEERWDINEFEIAPDGSFIVFVTDEAGVERMKLLDTASGAVRVVTSLPPGRIGSIEIAPWGDIGFSFSSAQSATDAYSIDPQTLAVTRWTQSETGGLDVTDNVDPELVTVESFDGLEVSGFLYRPDPAKFPGPRPLIVNIHGGPEGQSTPGFRGRNNYYLNELGIALFYPNVRGSTGYGKTFVSLDNGPFKREDSVADIGAFLDRLKADPALDADRFGVAGGSYGGYMCYASAIRYGDTFKGANCVVAISNFVSFLENTQDYRRDLRRVEYGDERDPAQRTKLIEISPLTRSQELRIPLFVVTGANDPRVPASEADQMVQAVRNNNGTAWHLLAQDEGHGFAKKANADYQFWTSLMFWEDVLLGE